MHNLLIKVMFSIFTSFLFSMIYAESITQTAQIKINLSSESTDNRYFMCFKKVGCVSVLAAKKGKIYRMTDDIEMDNMYIVNVFDRFRISPQGQPASCMGTVKKNQTLTIEGNIKVMPGNQIKIANFHCKIA